MKLKEEGQDGPRSNLTGVLRGRENGMGVVTGERPGEDQVKVTIDQPRKRPQKKLTLTLS